LARPAAGTRTAPKAKETKPQKEIAAGTLDRGANKKATGFRLQASGVRVQQVGRFQTDIFDTAPIRHVYR